DARRQTGRPVPRRPGAEADREGARPPAGLHRQRPGCRTLARPEPRAADDQRVRLHRLKAKKGTVPFFATASNRRFAVFLLSRREALTRCGTGLGMMALAGVMADAAGATPVPDPLAPRKPHFPGKARHVVHLFMNGGPS